MHVVNTPTYCCCRLILHLVVSLQTVNFQRSMICNSNGWLVCSLGISNGVVIVLIFRYEFDGQRTPFVGFCESWGRDYGSTLHAPSSFWCLMQAHYRNELRGIVSFW
jgi:hypothetical protein